MSEREWIKKAVAARQAQGLPTRVKDAAALRRIARLMAKKTT
jgi:hypothetical protein